jgi:TetR/AcrR family transcriptional regulator, regulator of mycofactocin system
MGRREEKKQETRERLRAAAFALFDRRGYDKTKVEDVAQAAGVSTRTVFRYFPQKADLVFSEVPEDIAQLAGLIAQRPSAEPPFVAMRNALIEFAPSLDSPANLDRARIVAVNPTLYRHSLEVRDAWGEAIGQALIERGGGGGGDAACRLLGHVAFAAMLMAARTWRDDGGRSATFSSVLQDTLDSLPRLVRMSP